MNLVAERRRVPTRRPAELRLPEPERRAIQDMLLEDKRYGSYLVELLAWFWRDLHNLFSLFMQKRMCRSLETVPQSISICHPPSKCAMDYWDMEQDLTQKSPIEFSSSPIMKEKPHYMIFPDNETRTTAQACLRCMAGEPGHFGHIMSL